MKQDVDSEVVPKTSIQSKRDIRNVRDVASKENVDNGINEGSNIGSHDSLGHEYIGIDMDRRVCISCDEGGKVLVCSERDCPITVHGKCICIEPKFDDNGNFYCPYCWLKRALAEVQEMRNKALAAKKNLSSFLDKRVITSDNQAKYGEAKRTEPEELSLVGNENNLEYCNRKGNDNVHSQPWQTVEENQKETEVIASADQDGIPVEGEAYANTQVADSCDSRYSEEKTPVHNDLIPKYTNREEFNVRNISEIYETRSAEGKGGIEQEEEAEPSSASHLEKYTTGDSTDIPFVKGKRESVAVSVDNNDSTKDREKVLQNETMVPAIDSSVGESHDAGSEAPLVKKRRMTQRVQKYPQRVSSVSEPLPLNKSIDGQNSCHENEEVTSSKTLRQTKVSSNQG